MAPEYGATMGFFPVDAETLKYLRLTGRSEEHVALVEAYTKAQGLFRTDETPDPVFTDTLELDLGTVEPSLAGPTRPQDRVPLARPRQMYKESLDADLQKLGTLAGDGAAEEGESRERVARALKAVMVAGRRRRRQPQHEPESCRARTTARPSRSSTAPSSSRRSRAAPTPRTRA